MNEKPKCECGEDLIYNKIIKVSKYFELDDNGYIKQKLSEWDIKDSQKIDLLYCNKCKEEYECEEADGQYYRKDVFDKLFYVEDIEVKKND
jgi:hypothetical protein